MTNITYIENKYRIYDFHRVLFFNTCGISSDSLICGRSLLKEYCIYRDVIARLKLSKKQILLLKYLINQYD